MQDNYTTSRLQLTTIGPGEEQFMLKLLNMPSWLTFIGDRNVHTADDAAQYIRKLMDSPDITYYIVKLIGTATSIGTISFIKREYLEYHDIGFAFLEDFGQQGYAFEAASAILAAALEDPRHQTVLATVAPGNQRSIHLLERLGLQYTGDIEVDGKKPLLFCINALK